MHTSSDRRHEFCGFEALESRQLLAGDLAVAIPSLTGPANPTTGVIRVNVEVSNAGDRMYRNGGEVLFFLSRDATLGAGDIAAGSKSFSGWQSPGSELQIRADLRVNDLVRRGASGAYRVLARVVAASSGFDTIGTNDVASSSSTFTLGGSSGGSGGNNGGGNSGGGNSGGSGGGTPTPVAAPAGTKDFAVSVGRVSNPFDSRDRRDEIRLTTTVRNAGTVYYNGGAKIQYYFSTDTTFNATSDFLFHEQRIDNLPQRGRTKDYSLDIAEPKLVAPPAPFRAVPEGTYTVFARIVLDNASYDTNAANNSAAGSGTVAVNYTFGRLTTGDVDLTTTFANGTTATFKIDRVGNARMTNENGRVVLTVERSERDSGLVIRSTNNAVVPISQIIANTAISTIRAQNAIISGSIIVRRYISQIDLAGITGSISITAVPISPTDIDGDGRRGYIANNISLNLGAVRDLTVVSNVRLKHVNVETWRNTDAAPDLLTAPAINHISSNRDFAPNVTATSFNSNRMSIDRVRVNGAVSGIWNLAAGLDNFDAGSVTAAFRATVTGPIDYLRTSGDFAGLIAAVSITNVQIGGNLRNATIMSGAILGEDVSLGGTGSEADDFGVAYIDRVEIRGSMINSIISVGIDTTDAILLNSDDTFATGGTSRMRSLIVRRTVDSNSSLVAQQFQSASIANRTVDILNDDRFITELPVD